MKPRTLLVLLAVVLGLGAYIWFYERDMPSSDERVKLSKQVLQVEKDDVTAVTVEASRGKIRLERTGTPPSKPKGEVTEAAASDVVWKIVEPLKARADAFAVDQLLGALTSLEKTRTLEEVDRRDVGLDHPRATVRLRTKDGEKVLQIGAEVPTGGFLIAGLEGDPDAYVVADTILADIDKDAAEWRDRRMFHGDREAVERLTLRGSEAGPVVLVRKPQGFWIEQPAAAADRADGEAVEGLFSDLEGLSAEQFAEGEYSLAELGLAPPREAVEVAVKGQPKPERIELGAPVTGEAAPEGQTPGELTWAKVGDTVFQARTRLAESLRKAPADWRARKLSGLEVYDVESATVSDGKGALKLTRADADWKRDGTLISFLPVSDLLAAVTGATAERLLAQQEAQALRLGKPVLTVTVEGKEKGAKETLTFYPAVAEGVPARSGDRATVLLLPKGTLAEIQKKVSEVRAAQPMPPAK